jgi:putative hydrolase
VTERQLFPRFRDLSLSDCLVDLQVHTTWTDGEQTIADALTAARDRGLHTIAITEHVRRDTEWFPDFAAEVRREAVAFPELTVLVGCEAKALDDNGDLDALEQVTSRCDIVLGSVHRFPDGQGGLLEFSALSPDAMAERETALAVGLLRHAPIDVLAHPGGMYQRKHGEFPEAGMRAILAASLERGVAVEISSSYHPDLKPFLSLCREMNPLVSIGSDAHTSADVGRCSAVVRQALFAS